MIRREDSEALRDYGLVYDRTYTADEIRGLIKRFYLETGFRSPRNLKFIQASGRLLEDFKLPPQKSVIKIISLRLNHIFKNIL